MNITDLKTYQKMSGELFESVGQSIGIHVLLLVIEHALWQTKQKNEDAVLIKLSEDGLCFDELESIAPERASQVAHELIMAIIATLGKLVGLQLANQLTEQLQLFRGEK